MFTRIGSFGVFWLWNIIFCFASLFLVFALMGLITEGLKRGEWAPGSVIFCLIMLILLPPISIGLELFKFRKDHRMLAAYFYGVEAPLLLVCWIRLTIFGELTVGALFLLVSVGLGAFLYLYYLLRANWFKSIGHYLDLAQASSLLVIAVYTAVLLSLFVVPPLWQILSSIFAFNWVVEIVRTLSLYDAQSLSEMVSALAFALVFGMVIVILGSFFFVLPFAYIRLYFGAWLDKFPNVKPVYACVISAVVVSLWIGVFYIFSYQPQGKAFALLEKTASTVEDKKRNLAEEETIRAGLLNAYLHGYRYLGSRDTANSISTRFRDASGVMSQISGSMQALFNHLIAPVLYNGSSGDDAKAEALYRSFFDAPIQQKEATAILNTVNSMMIRGNKAGLLDASRRKVHLVEQRINVKQEKAVTQVELYEVYENKTSDNQEVYYNFSLPDNAALTGIWLGSSKDLEKRFKYAISPRGAAQRVYNQQVRQRVDPALLEQVGPGQYRLRVYPVLPYRNRAADAPRQHFWMTYSVLTSRPQNVLPQLLARRNVYWDEDTRRTFNGKVVAFNNNWMPDRLLSQPVEWEQEVVYVKSKAGLYKASVSKAPPFKAARIRKAAVVLDSSYSMRESRVSAVNEIKFLQGKADKIDVYVRPFNENLRILSEADYELKNLVFYGHVSHQSLWRQAVSVQDGKAYDVVFVLTDQGNYELEDKEIELTKSEAPVFFVHSHILASQYTDALSKLIMRNKNGVATSAEVAYRKFILRKIRMADQRTVGEFLWSFSRVEEGEEVVSALTPVAARVLINHIAAKGDKPTVEDLDAIHELAKTHSVLTPYSSMIVLVNEVQREQLRRAEQKNDRFVRDHESGKKVLSKPGSPLVFGTPEPEEWVLLIIALMLLSYFYYRREGQV